jgi:hypothetical protein
LVYNWLHPVGQNHFYVIMLLYREAAFSRVYTYVLFFKQDSVRISWQLNSVPLQPSGRRDIMSGHSTVQASSIRTTRTFHPDLPLCQEASNCSSLYPSGRLSSMSRCHSIFDQLWDFFLKHRYGKTAATIRTMWIPIQMRSFIRHVEHSNFRRSDDSLHGPDAQASYMEITCIRSTVRTTDVMVRKRQALIWKLCAAKVRPFRRKGNTVWTRLNSGKNFSEIWKADHTVVRPNALCLPSRRRLGILSQTLI